MYKDYSWVFMRKMLIERQTTGISNRIKYTPREVVLQPFAVRQRCGGK